MCAFLIGTVKADRPAVLEQKFQNRFQVRFHPLGQRRTRIGKIFEVIGRGDQHFPGSNTFQKVVAFIRLYDIVPSLEVVKLETWSLCEKLVANAYRHPFIEFSDTVIVRIVEETARTIQRRVIPKPLSARK